MEKAKDLKLCQNLQLIAVTVPWKTSTLSLSSSSFHLVLETTCEKRCLIFPSWKKEEKKIDTSISDKFLRASYRTAVSERKKIYLFILFYSPLFRGTESERKTRLSFKVYVWASQPMKKMLQKGIYIESFFLVQSQLCSFCMCEAAAHIAQGEREGESLSGCHIKPSFFFYFSPLSCQADQRKKNRKNVVEFCFVTWMTPSDKVHMKALSGVN